MSNRHSNTRTIQENAQAFLDQGNLKVQNERKRKRDTKTSNTKKRSSRTCLTNCPRASGEVLFFIKGVDPSTNKIHLRRTMSSNQTWTKQNSSKRPGRYSGQAQKTLNALHQFVITTAGGDPNVFYSYLCVNSLFYSS